MLVKLLDKILEGRATRADLEKLGTLANTVKMMSRCGLGQSAGNPVLTTMNHFSHLYDARLKPDEFIPSFELSKAVAVSEEITGRKFGLEE